MFTQPRPPLPHRASVLFALAGLAAAPAIAQDSYWQPASGDWGNPANWSPMNVPDTLGEHAHVLNGGVATMNASYDVGAISIGGGSAVQLANGRTLNLHGDIANDGVFEVLGTNSVTYFYLRANATLSGDGELRLVGGNSTGINRVYGTTGLVLTNGPEHTIRALDSASLGVAAILIDNAGLIVADGSGAGAGELLVDPRNAAEVTFTNTGTLRAENGGLLSLSGSGNGRFDNAGGLVEALDGSTVRLVDGAEITGGTLRTEGSGAVSSPSGTWTAFTNDGLLLIPNNGDLNVAGAIDNAGEVRLAGTNSVTYFHVLADTTLFGGGRLAIAGGASTGINRVYASSAGENVTLTNAADHLIRVTQAASIGYGTLNVLNAGEIVGADEADLLIDPRNANGVTFTNAGVVRAQEGGRITLSGSGGGRFDNTGGLVEALDGSTVRLVDGAEITGGTLRTEGSGAVSSPSGTWTAFTNDGLLLIPNNGDLNVAGAIDNAGEVRLAGTNSVTYFHVLADTTLFGGGRLAIAGGASTGINRVYASSAGENVTLTNAADHLIRVTQAASIGYGTLNVLNAGEIVGADEADLLIDPRNANAVAFTNTGSVRAEAGGRVTLSGSGNGRFDNERGVVEALDASAVHLTSGADVAGGVFRTEGSGTIFASSGFWSDGENRGRLVVPNSGHLGLSGAFVNTGEIRLAGSASVTYLEILSDTTLSGGGRLAIAGGASTGINRIYSSSPGANLTLTNENGHTISVAQAASLGYGTLNIANHGHIVAGAEANLLIDPRNANAIAFTNTGTIRAENGGLITLSGSGGGRFRNDGALEARAGGAIEAVSGAAIDNFSNATLTGGVYTADHATLNIAPAGFQLAANEATVIVRGADAATNIFGGAPGAFTSAAFALNAGVLELTEGAALAITLPAGASFTNAGDLLIGSGSAFALAAPARSLLNDEEAVLRGSGSIDAALTSHGLLAPGDAPAAVGTLSVSGPVALHGGFAVDVGPESDRLAVDAGLVLGGVLVVTAADPTAVSLGDEYTVATAGGGITGSFTTVVDNVPGLDLIQVVSGNALIIRVAPVCLADLNKNGSTDVNDLLAYLGAFRAGDADITGDGATDVNDLLGYLGAFRQGC